MILPELGVIRKRRRTYAKDHVVIHLDEVDDLGQFVDIVVSWIIQFLLNLSDMYETRI